MLCLKNLVKLKSQLSEKCLLGIKSPVVIQTATIMKLDPPPNYDDVEYPPDRRRLKMLERVPQPLVPSKKPRTMRKSRFLMRGPEEIHNKIIYGEFGIQATGGGRLHFGHLEGIRSVIVKKMDEKKSFAIWRIDAPWMPVSNKGSTKRMGGGKAPINKYWVPIRPDRLIFEVGGECEFAEVRNFLQTINNMLPVKSRIVTRKLLEEEAEEKERLEKLNQNPFTFEYCAKNNMLGIDVHLSPYDYKWFGKYR